MVSPLINKFFGSNTRRGFSRLFFSGNSMDFAQDIKDGCRLEIRLTPKAKKDCIGSLHDGRLKVSVTSPPIDDRANTHLVKLLAKTLKTAKSDLKIIAGKTSRNKSLMIQNMDAATVKKRLGL